MEKSPQQEDLTGVVGLWEIGEGGRGSFYTVKGNLGYVSCLFIVDKRLTGSNKEAMCMTWRKINVEENVSLPLKGNEVPGMEMRAAAYVV